MLSARVTGIVRGYVIALGYVWVAGSALSAC